MPTGLGDEKLWLCPSLDDSADDISGNGNHGTYNGGMGTVADVSSGGTRAYLFDGSNTQRIECPASAIGSEPIISVSCWGYVNIHDASYGEGLVSQFGAGNNSSTCKFSLATLGGSSIFPANWIRPSTTNVTAASTNAISAQSWHHFCLVADGSTIYNYVDGVLQASTSYTGSVRSVTNPFVIGTYNQLINSNHYLNGRIDDVRAFDRALSTTEITHLATSRGIEGSPYAYSGLGDEKLWLCPSLDDSADDISGNGNHGTYNGGMGTVADVSNGGTRAYFFDATDDYISSFPTAITSFVGDPAGTSVSCWIKKAATGTDPIFIATLGGSSNGWYGQVLVTLSGAKKELLIKSLGVLDYIDSQDADDTDWHHYAISFDASRNATFYYDGASKGTAAVASPGTSGIALQIGGRAGAIDLVSMYVDDYRIFDGELTLSEAQALASKRGYEVPAAASGSTPHPLSAPIFHPLG